MKLGMFVSIVLFFLWLITGITGTILLLGRPASLVRIVDALHVHLGFAFFGPFRGSYLPELDRIEELL
ncbi:hypothetical protein QDY65_01660 [Pyrococcus kukulkanii]|uniref:hypothetical protein n=1 Tax=Pyrococcus kukulkanii TaxID=1609559 RepID=UPI003567850F